MQTFHFHGHILKNVPWGYNQVCCAYKVLILVLYILKHWYFQTVVLEKTLESPLDCNRSNQSILKETSPEHCKD